MGVLAVCVRREGGSSALNFHSKLRQRGSTWGLETSKGCRDAWGGKF